MRRFIVSIQEKIRLRESAKRNTNYADIKVNQQEQDIEQIFMDLENNITYGNQVKSMDYKFAITSHRKVIGPIIVLGKKIFRKLTNWQWEGICLKQNIFNHTLMTLVEKMKNIFIEQQQDLTSIKQKHQEEILALKEELSVLRSRGQEELSAKEEIKKIQHELNQNIEVLRDEYNQKMVELEEAYNQKISVLKEESLQQSSQITAELSGMQQKISDMLHQLACVKQDNKYLRFKASQSHMIESIEVGQEDKQKLVINENMTRHLNYFSFENTFRGPEEMVMKRQRVYIPYFENKKNVLDIGCGRGEFLQLLKVNNVEAAGIDINEEFVEYCQYNKLRASHKDALEYLKTVEDNSLDGIFIGQVVEHLSEEYLETLITETYRKLANGAYMIVETPNPKNLGIFSNSFYIDPSHVKPVHPEYLKYLMNQEGFEQVREIYSSPVENGLDIEAIQDREVQRNFSKINDVLFGNQDYALIVRK